MKKILSSICFTCIHSQNCVLTKAKSQVWCCNEFESEQKLETLKL